MRQIIFTLVAVAFLALAHVVAGQISPSGGRKFDYSAFQQTDEHDFGVEFNPTFTNNHLDLMYYDPYASEERNEVGAVWYKTRVLLESFNVTFTLSMSNLSHTGVGNPDGFALVVQNYRANAFGAAGGGLGYGATPDYEDLGIRKSVAVEFDTYLNDELSDPNSNHISVHYTTADRIHNSAHEDDSLNPPGAATNVPPIAGATHKYNVLYVNQQLSVYIDDSTTPAYQATLDIPSILTLNSSGGFVGLTASCVSTCEDIEVLNWHYNYVSVLDPTKTFVTGYKNETTAGRLAYLTIQGVDTNGYFYLTGGDASKYSVSFAPVGGFTSSPPTGRVVDKSDGSYLVEYTPSVAGQYDVTVSYNGNPISGVPFRITVDPAPIDATKSDVTLSTTGGIAGQPQNITILGKDSWGNINYNNVPSATFTASFNGTSSTFGSSFVGNGTYLITYTLTAAKTYSLSLTYNSTTQQVKGSPFAVTIQPADPEASASYAAGVGIVGGTAGVSLPVTVVVRDRFQNNITRGMSSNYQLYGSWDKATAGSNVSFSLQGDGTYGASYAINTAGTYKLSIFLAPSNQPIYGSPFTVAIVPQTVTSPGQSVAFGSGLTTAAAGSNATFTVQARDAYGNNMTSSDAVISVSFTDDSSTAMNIAYTATQNSDNKALFTVSYIPTLASTTRINVNLNGAPIKGSPFSVNVQPGALDPKKSFAQGLGLVTPKTKTPLSFVVITADKYNNRLRTGGANIVVNLKEQKSGATVAGSVQDLNNGAYNVGFTLTKSGTYNITITANGQAIDNDAQYSLIVPSEGLGALGWALIILGIIALIAIVGGGAFWYLKYYKARSDYDEIGA